MAQPFHAVEFVVDVPSPLSSSRGTNCALQFNSIVGLLFPTVSVLIPSVRGTVKMSNHEKRGVGSIQ
jgi:hypothetical protein